MAQAAQAAEVKDDFDAAFDEAVTAAETPVVETGDEPAPVVKAEPKKELAAAPAKTAEEIKAEEDAAAAATAAAKPAPTPVEIATEAFTKAQEQIEARQSAKAKKDAEDAAAAKAVKDAEDAAAALEAPYVLAADEKEALDKMEKDFPNEFKAMQARLKQESKAMTADLARSVKTGMDRIAALEKQIKPVAEVVQTREQDAHFAAIKTAHTDFDEVIKGVPAWIEKLPAHRRIGAQAVYDQGDAASIIELVSDYKKENNIVTPKPGEEPAAGGVAPKKEEPKPATKKPTPEEIASGAPVGSRRATPSVKGAPDKDDYDGAWEEATKD